MSDTVTLCDVCGKAAKNTCKMCGRRLCSNHYDRSLGLCHSCKAGRRIGV